jgi:hypothetical protein
MTAVRSSSRNQAASGTATTVPVPTGCAAGDALIVIGHINNNPTWVDNNGANPLTKDNTYQPAGNAALHVWSHRVTSGDLTAWSTNLDFTAGSSTRWTLVAICIQDPDPSVIYDATTVEGLFNSTGSTTATADAITATSAGAIHLPCFGADGSGTTITTTPLTGAGYTVAQNGGNQALCVGHKTVAAGSTGQTTVTLPGGTQWLALSIAVRIAAAGLTPTSRTPSDDATAISPSTDEISLTFNANIQAGTGDIVLKTSGGSTVETIPIGDAQVDITGAVLTVTLTSALGEGAFYVEIANTCIEPLGGGAAWSGFSGATAWNFSSVQPPNLGYAPIPCVDANPVFESSNTAGQRDELKAGVIVFKRTEGYPGALSKYSGLLEVIESGTPQPTFPTRIAGRTPLTLAYYETDANGPIHVWGSGESGTPWFNEDIPDVIFPRRDGAGWVAFTHVGNNGADARTSRMRYCSGYDFTGWTEAGVTIIAQGGVGTWDEDIVAEPPGVWLPNGKLKLFYRGGAVWNTDAQIGMAETVWDGNVSSLPTLTKYASNPVIATGAQSWLSSGAAPGGMYLEPRAASTDGYRYNMWLGARLASAGYGHTYSDDGGQTFTVSATALALPVSPQTSLGDAVFVNADETPPRPNGGHIVWLFPGADAGGPEGRYAAYIPLKRAVADITRRGRFYFPTGTPYTAITATASGGGVQQYTAFVHVGEFCKPTGDRSVEFATFFQQGDANGTDHTYHRINQTTGVLDCYWRTATRELTVSSSAAVDDGIPHKYALVATGGNQLHLFLEREGKWTLEVSSSSSSLGTFTSAVNIAIGNAHPSNNYGNFPFRGTVSDMVFASGGTPPTDINGVVAAVHGLLDSSRTAHSGGTVRWSLLADGTDNGEVVPVETVEWLDTPAVSTDGSTGTTDQAITGSLFLPGASERGRIVWLDAEWKNVSTGITAITFDGVTMQLAHSRSVSTAGVATYYLLSDSLPATAGVYNWSVTVDGAAGQVHAVCSYKSGMMQRGPFATGGADGTSTSITASVNAPSNGWIRDVLHNATGTDDATPHATQTELADFSGDTTNAGRIATSIRPSWVQSSFDMSWSGITTSEQHILIATSWQVEDPRPVFALQQPLVPANRPS